MADEPLHTRDVVAGFLVQKLGPDAAAAIVDETCMALALPDALSREQCLAVLEHIALQEGVVGVTARFAKSRAILALGT